ncbi:MAG: type II toxin-antitoxin system prevent-host-death family antitoxin [Verrucomicrobiota bacterium]
MRHVKTITIRELHARTGKLVREASRHGEIRVTDNGRTVAKILPEAEPGQVPYFARRKYVSAAIRKLIENGGLGQGGTDGTVAIAEDREDRV